ncbi:sigma-70 family RNA polymerase sigma factor [Catellatospora sp. KI3]|uniref:RNA polymerase sigma factor n=1 Tax=Catellatospora sp. KI3 TaxID=3041620 RepID=UPI0024825387|nr:sigma-70 family RNA polymerase sigma factor [Catellatospora sp. KI3]MDI1464470.1 sigma-70 family RNA polymerase sigma factor [Catellatospora sp. KI3]
MLADFEECYAAHFQGIALQIAAYIGNAADAQDIVQEAFARALPRWAKLAGYADPGAWVRHVAWNLAKTRWRRQQRLNLFLRRHREEHLAGPGPDRVALTSALAKLPEMQRRAFVLHYIGELTIAEIAEQERTPEGTVKSWLHRARAAMAAQLGTGAEERDV